MMQRWGWRAANACIRIIECRLRQFDKKINQEPHRLREGIFKRGKKSRALHTLTINGQLRLLKHTIELAPSIDKIYLLIDYSAIF
jgi:hypothetical protein